MLSTQIVDQRPAESQVIDWNGIRAAALALNSVNEAAKQAAIDLPPVEAERFRERVNKRAYRERWLDPIKQPRIANELPLSKNVQSGHNALATAFHSRKTKIKSNLSKYLVNASKVAARSRKPLEDSADVKNVASVMTSVYPEEKEQAHSDLHLNILAGQANLQFNQATPQP